MSPLVWIGLAALALRRAPPKQKPPPPKPKISPEELAKQQKIQDAVQQAKRDSAKIVAVMTSEDPESFKRAVVDLKAFTEEDLRRWLRLNYNLNPFQVEEVIEGFRKGKASPPIKAPTNQTVWPSWISWEIFSWATLEKIGDYVWDEWFTWKGLGAVVAVVVIGPELLLYFGLSTGARMGAAEVIFAAMNAKDLIEAATRGTGATLAVFDGQLWEAVISGGPQGSFMRQLLGALIGSEVAYTIEHAGK